MPSGSVVREKQLIDTHGHITQQILTSKQSKGRIFVFSDAAKGYSQRAFCISFCS
jgi:hypothetical protein